MAIHTHGCKLNQADSELLARRFIEAGYRIVEAAEAADVVVLNTCTVTATADSKARQALRAAHRANPKAIVVATGCYAQRAAEELSRMEAVSLVVGNTQKDQLVSAVTAALDARSIPGQLDPVGRLGAATGENPKAEARQAPGPATPRSRAMVKIQEGCDQVCAYCIVPKVRGRERSVAAHTLVAEINYRSRLAGEVVLTGTQLGSYGFDIPGASLLRLLRRILAETEVPRLRVSSLQPQEITPELLELWQDRRLCPHFHIPLQSGSDRILRAMRRRYTTAQFARTVALVRREVPNAGITSDIIVGFPGEGEEEFNESRRFARSMEFSDTHVFPFSPRPGTSAIYLTGRVPGPVRKTRTAEILGDAAEGFRAFRTRQLGQIRPVLWESVRETETGQAWSGLTDNYIRVRAARA
ncbi:MAG: tRNA (N(6)-L-threonylcarbamoyladenosine(37)-C(2))-methylthiotransferase MtaB, partial [Chloroflexota bacterium]